MKCSFCGKEVEQGTGIIYSQRDGTIYTFCSRTCEKNQLKLKRKPQKTKWTQHHIEEKKIRLHGKEKVEKEYVRVTKKKTTKKERRETRTAKKSAIKADKKKRKEEKAKAPKPKPTPKGENKE